MLKLSTVVLENMLHNGHPVNTSQKPFYAWLKKDQLDASKPRLLLGGTVDALGAIVVVSAVVVVSVAAGLGDAV